MAGTQEPLQTPQAQELLQNPAKLRSLLASPEVRRLAQLLSSTGGGTLQQAAGKAKAGDSTQLQQLVQSLSSTEEGARLLEQLQGKLGK